MISRGDNLKSHFEKVYGSEKPDDSEIKRPYTDNRGENLKSYTEQANSIVQGSFFRFFLIILQYLGHDAIHDLTLRTH